MMPIVARKLFHLQELVLGRDSFKILEELNASQWWRKERLDQLREQRLQQLVHQAYTHTAYWRTIMDDNGIEPDRVGSLEELRQFPLLEKQTLRDRLEEMVWRGEGKRVQLVRTSGSTNEALEFYTSSIREAHINAARMRGHEWVGIFRGDKELYYWGSPIELSKQDRVKRFRDWLVNDGLTNGFELDADRLKTYYHQWLAWRPRCMFGYPSTFVLTASMCGNLGLDLKALKQKGLKTIITTSEMLSDCDRQIIENCFGVPVYDSYGLREAGLIGHECSHRTMHCMDEQLILETIDPNTLEPTDGEGELVVTNIASATFPIIRYRTGDIVTLAPADCPCGRSMSTVKVTGGRAVEFIVTNQGKWVVGYSFIYIARSVKGIVKFQVIQEKIGEILIRLSIDGHFPKDGIDQVKQQAAKRLGSDDEIRVELVDDIVPAPSGKYRPVISKVAEDLCNKGAFSCTLEGGKMAGR